MSDSGHASAGASFVQWRGIFAIASYFVVFSILLFYALFCLWPSGSGLALASVDPQTGANNGGSTVTLSGTGFESSAEVYFGDVKADTVAMISVYELKVTVPKHPE